jgi:hypothetical protein
MAWNVLCRGQGWKPLHQLTEYARDGHVISSRKDVPMTVGSGHHMQYKTKEAYSADNKRLGQIVDTHADYVVVQTGRLIAKIFFLPTWLLAGSDADRAYLNLTKDEAHARMRQRPPPAGDAWYTDAPPAGGTVPA